MSPRRSSPRSRSSRRSTPRSPPTRPSRCVSRPRRARLERPSDPNITFRRSTPPDAARRADPPAHRVATGPYPDRPPAPIADGPSTRSPLPLSLLFPQTELESILKDYVGRANPLYFAERLTELYGTADIYLKREDLNHTGAHKINNAVGQALLAKKMGKKRIIAETGAGQHGVATATVCARFGLECIIYMGAADMERQKLNVFRMRLLGATVKPVRAGTATLRMPPRRRSAIG